MGFNPSALYAVADRLAQAEQNWQPFHRDGWKKLVFPCKLNRFDQASLSTQRGAWAV